MRAFFRIWGNDSQPGLQQVKKLATPLFWYSVYEKVGISSERKSKEIGDFSLTVTKDQKGWHMHHFYGCEIVDKMFWLSGLFVWKDSEFTAAKRVAKL